MGETKLPRLRLKADGRIVEILSDGRERALAEGERPPVAPPSARLANAAAAMSALPVSDVKNGTIPPVPQTAISSAKTAKAPDGETDSAYARRVRAATHLTQAEFAMRLGVPIETVRNWEQGKRSPRGPARALLKLIDRAPDFAFAALAGHRRGG